MHIWKCTGRSYFRWRCYSFFNPIYFIFWIFVVCMNHKNILDQKFPDLRHLAVERFVTLCRDQLMSCTCFSPYWLRYNKQRNRMPVLVAGSFCPGFVCFGKVKSLVGEHALLNVHVHVFSKCGWVWFPSCGFEMLLIKESYSFLKLSNHEATPYDREKLTTGKTWPITQALISKQLL